MTDFNWMLWIVTPIIIVYYLYRHVWPAVRQVYSSFSGHTHRSPFSLDGSGVQEAIRRFTLCLAAGSLS